MLVRFVTRYLISIFGATGGLNVYEWTCAILDTCVDNAKIFYAIYFTNVLFRPKTAGINQYGPKSNVTIRCVTSAVYDEDAVLIGAQAFHFSSLSYANIPPTRIADDLTVCHDGSVSTVKRQRLNSYPRSRVIIPTSSLLTALITYSTSTRVQQHAPPQL